MKNITQVLSDEHQTILKTLTVMLAECDAIEAGQELNTAFFNKAIAFIKNYADKFHHAKEEDILFKVMLENVDHLHCNPIPVMLHEHDEGRAFVQGMEAGIADNNASSIIQNARGYCMLLEQHIYKEDNVLYPMAEEALSEEQKELVNKAYQEAETKLNAEMNIEALKIV